MGTIVASTILNKAANQLTDIANIRWSSSELLGWLNDGQRQIVATLPSANNIMAVKRLSAGTRQSIATDGWLLLGLYRNMGTTGTTPGSVIRLASREVLDAYNQNWHTDTAKSTVKNYVFDIQDQTAFWVYPPNDGNGYVQYNYSQVPPDLSAPTSPIVLNDIYQTALLDYIMYRACSKDAEYAPGLALAQGYWSAFSYTLSNKFNAESQANPNLSIQNPRPVGSPGAGS
jgi:hypothetical protein